ncbi:MAG: glycosyltransferase family 4 protein [Candidatus Omnitrophica bacterium]|nr:glycosyltransferase family 4 protein [Candidatus Omnitrophota bacterium]
MPALRICLLSQNYPPSTHLGGIGVVVHRLAAGLSAAGHRVHVIARAEGQDRESTQEQDGVTVHRVRPVALPRGLWRLERLHPTLGFRIRYSVRVNQQLQALIAQGEMGVVVSPDYNGEAWWFTRVGKRVPLVVSLHGPSFTARQGRGSWRARLEDWLERDLVNRADRIHAVSGNIADLVAERFHVLRQRIQVIHNPMDLQAMGAVRNGSPAGATPCVVYAGRLEHRKGADVLARAIPLVHARHPQTQFLLIGRDSAPSTAERMRALAGGSANRMRFLGQQPHAQVLAHYRHSTVCVFPSRVEPFGTVGLEAMACGKPVVATTGTGFVEMIEHGVSGLLVPPGDADALAGQIIRLLDDAALRHRLGTQARATIERQFTTAQILPQWEVLLRQAARAEVPR